MHLSYTVAVIAPDGTVVGTVPDVTIDPDADIDLPSTIVERDGDAYGGSLQDQVAKAIEDHEALIPQ